MGDHTGILPGRVYFPVDGWDRDTLGASLMYWLVNSRAPVLCILRRQEHMLAIEDVRGNT